VRNRNRRRNPPARPPETAAKPEGLRERKRRQTRQRIVQEGLRLFLANGFDATTLDDIAAAADISRRTFFYYFKSKEDIVMAWHADTGDAWRAVLLEESPAQAPVDAVLNALLKMSARYTSQQTMAIDRLLRSNESLRARKQAGYVQREQEVFTALTELWPQPERRTALRAVAMASIGALRLAMEAWNQDGGTRPVADYLREVFTNLKTEF
jgi:AcrR family transcriptional regulator